MAIFTIRPNRGTVSFFGLLVLALLARSGWTRFQEYRVQRDGPPAHTTRRLLRCMLGRDAERMLWPRPAGDDPSAWADTITQRLRRTVTEHWGPEWPARCTPLAERLHTRLTVGGNGAQRGLAAAAGQVHGSLVAAAHDRMRALGMVESGELGRQIATLTLGVLAISPGAERGWDSALPFEETDLAPLRLATVPTPLLLPADADRPLLLRPDRLLYQSARDGQLHLVDYAADGELPQDRPLGAGAPWPGGGREGTALVTNEAGEPMLLPGGDETPSPLPLVEALPPGEPLGEWQLARTPGYHWLLTEEEATLHLRTAPRTAPRTGARTWSVQALPASWMLQMLGGTVRPGAGDAVEVLGARCGAAGVWIERQLVSLAPVTPPSARTRRRARPVPAEPVPVALTSVWPAFAPKLRLCAAGSVRYLLVTAHEGMTMVAVGDEGVRRHTLPATVTGMPEGRFELTCNEDGALLFADFPERPGTLVHFDRQAAAPAVLVPPLCGESTPPEVRGTVVGGALTAQHGVLALVQHERSVRAYRSREGVAWEGGTLVAELAPRTGRGPHGPPSVEVFAVLSAGDEVALLAGVQHGRQRFVGRLHSGDGGASWSGL